jgi:hypothetical protein
MTDEQKPRTEKVDNLERPEEELTPKEADAAQGGWAPPPPEVPYPGAPLPLPYPH